MTHLSQCDEEVGKKLENAWKVLEFECGEDVGTLIVDVIVLSTVTQPVFFSTSTQAFSSSPDCS